MRVFEAELSPPDQALWEKVAKEGSQFDGTSIPISLRDFPAQQMRLTRELFGEELRNVTAK